MVVVGNKGKHYVWVIYRLYSLMYALLSTSKDKLPDKHEDLFGHHSVPINGERASGVSCYTVRLKYMAKEQQMYDS